MGPEPDPFLPTSPEFVRDPYPFYDRLRETDPVHWSEGLGAWVVTRYRDVVAGVQDDRLSARRMPALLSGTAIPDEHRSLILERSAAQMISADSPEHARLRGLASSAFAPRRIAALRPRVAAIADALLDDVVPRGRMDVVADYAHPLPMIVIGELLGIPADDLPNVKAWADVIAGFMSTGRVDADEVERYLAAWQAMADYLRVLASGREVRDEDDDIVSLLLRRRSAGEATEDEVVANLVLFAVAGHETTTNTLALGINALLDHPVELERLVDDAALIPGAIEEILRYEATSQRTIRLATEPIAMGDRDISAGSLVVFMLGAANRDPDAFRDPHRFDVGRSPNRHVTFSHGPHFCLGAALARMELQASLAAFVSRVREPRRTGSEPEWRPNVRMRGLTRLPIGFEVA